ISLLPACSTGIPDSVCCITTQHLQACWAGRESRTVGGRVHNSNNSSFLALSALLPHPTLPHLLLRMSPAGDGISCCLCPLLLSSCHSLKRLSEKMCYKLIVLEVWNIMSIETAAVLSAG
uniref:Uncharacterized protein n=1 Tax=Anas zonorhyncha TaxID=75864 RepID=A0A8B9V5G2_9AVES